MPNKSWPEKSLDKSGKPKQEIAERIKLGLPKLHQQVKQAEQAKLKEPATASSMPNRICLMLDVSGSMASPPSLPSRHSGSKTKIDYLREAVNNFLDSVNFEDTSVAIATFPSGESYYKEEIVKTGELTCDKTALVVVVQTLGAGGGTPMGRCIAKVIEALSITRCVIVSDGQATDIDHSDEGKSASDLCYPYVDMKIPIDTIHLDIGGGAELLEYIAKLTGGVFIKFSDVGNFAKSLKYLTPKHRALLNSPEAARLLGADEVR